MAKHLDSADMTPGQINKALDKLDVRSSKNTRAFIDAGRGYERPFDADGEIGYLSKSDPLSREALAIWEKQKSLRNEIARRYGPGAPSRMPLGFKRKHR